MSLSSLSLILLALKLMKTPTVQTPYSSRKSAVVSSCVVLVRGGLISVFAYAKSLLILLIVLIITTQTGPLATRPAEITGHEMSVKPLMLAVPKRIAELLATTLPWEMSFGAFAEATLRGSSFPVRWPARVSKDPCMQRTNSFIFSSSEKCPPNRPNVRGWPSWHKRTWCAPCAWQAFPSDFRFLNSTELPA